MPLESYSPREPTRDAPTNNQHIEIEGAMRAGGHTCFAWNTYLQAGKARSLMTTKMCPLQLTAAYDRFSPTVLSQRSCTQHIELHLTYLSNLWNKDLPLVSNQNMVEERHEHDTATKTAFWPSPISSWSHWTMTYAMGMIILLAYVPFSVLGMHVVSVLDLPDLIPHLLPRST